MQLEKVLEEIDVKIAGSMGKKREGLLEAENIIRKHLSCENAAEIKRSSRDNDGWIPVEDRLPEDEIPTPKLVTALVPDRKARWDNSETFSVIVDTDVYDPDYTGKWEYYKKNVIAWRPLPEPYRPESEKEKPDWRQDMLRKFDRRE